MARYVLGRLISLVFVLLVVSFLAFILMHAVPGGPFDTGERRLPEATRHAQLKKYGLDKSIPEQYVRYIWAVLHGDFGVPFQSPNETVTGLIARAWPVTIKIGMPTIMIAFTFGTLLGFIAAMRQNSLDRLRRHHGRHARSDGAQLRGRHLADSDPQHALGLAANRRLGRAEALHHAGDRLFAGADGAGGALRARFDSGGDAGRSRAHGPGERACRAAGPAPCMSPATPLIPAVTVLLPEIPNILTGSIFIESVFRIPGLGRFFVTSTISRDYPMILALMLLIAASGVSPI